MRHSSRGTVYALDGRENWRMPPLGTPTKKDVSQDGTRIGAVMNWPVGTWDLKSEHYGALGLFLAGPDDATGRYAPGAVFYPDHCDREYFRQLTAEYLDKVTTSTGAIQHRWVRRSDRRNEALDIAVYARALAHHLGDSLKPVDWLALAAERMERPAEAQMDLAALWAPGVAPPAAPPAEAPREDGGAPAEAPREDARVPADWLGGRGANWFN